MTALEAGSSVAFDFALPPELEAGEPPEARGLARDEVRLLVSRRSSDRVEHARFREIGRFLEPGDLLVVNTSATIGGALRAWREDGAELELHLSTDQGDGVWELELRTATAKGAGPFRSGRAGERLELPDGASVRLLAPVGGGQRLWRGRLSLPSPMDAYLGRFGFPIRYSYVRDEWPLTYYQTVFATEKGSAEMPSAGRGFTAELVTALVAQGVQFAPILLHTGVASMEEHEPPYPEFYRVPAVTARAVNSAKAAGSKVIAVGTSVVRALETAGDSLGRIHPSEGWTDLVVTAGGGIRAVDGLLTGFHEPHATHLAMLEAFAGRAHLQHVYSVALDGRYLWHEFGDLHLLLP